MSLHDELLKQARRTMLSQISVTDRLIRNLYIRAAKNLGGQIRKAKKGSLTERWLKAYKAELEKEIQRLNSGIYSAIEDGARTAAGARTECEKEYLRRAAAKAGVDESFDSVLTSVPTDTLRAMLDGKMYTDGRMLSRRIWDATGRLEGNIAEIIQQGVAQKMDALTLARCLEAYVNPKAACPVDWRILYPDIPFARNVDYNALRLARTSITHAHWAAGKAAAKKNPLCKGMKWNLSDSHYERQVAIAGEDICDEYAWHDEGLGKGVFPIDKIPMPHPHCLCYQTEETPDLEEAAELLAKWAKGEQMDARMEQAFREWEKEKAQELDNWYKAEEALDNSAVDDTIEAGYERRLTNSGAFAELKIPMELRTVRQILKNMELDYSGVKIRIERNDEYVGKPLFGYTYPDGRFVELYPSAFANIEQLCETLAHEYCHLVQISEGRIPMSSEESFQIETEAETFALKWWDQNKERMLGRYETTGWQ